MTTTLILALLIGIALGAGVLALVDRLRRRRVAELETSAHATAARIVEPVAKPSSTRITILSRASGEGRSPR